MRRLLAFSAALAWLLLAPVFALAADDAPAYGFRLTAALTNDDECTVELTLTQTAGGIAPIYGWQDELWYDTTQMELLDITAADGVLATERTRDGYAVVYIDFLSADGADISDAPAAVLRFRIMGDEAILTQKNYLVSLPDGSDSYAAAANDLLIELPAQEGPAPTAEPAEAAETPLPAETPQPENIENAGGAWIWPAAIGAAVLALFAIGFAMRKTVTFDSCGGTPIAPRKTRPNGTLRRPDNPAKDGASFGGWYTAPEGGERWSFEKDRAKENLTLYARWL